MEDGDSSTRGGGGAEEGGESDWSVYYAGFVKKKNVLGIFFTRYAVLDDTTLVFYEDETESDEKERFSISTSWMIEPIAGFDFKLADTGKSGNSVIMSVEKFEYLEAWMLALTQSINGPYRDSENFCSGEEITRSSSSSDHQLFDCHFTSECVDSDFVDVDFELVSCMYKQDSSILFTKSWKKIWCRLKNNAVLEYSDTEDFAERTAVFLDDQSKVIRLPENFQGQKFGLSLLTTETKKDKLKNLRLGTDNDVLLHRWADFMNYCIDCYNKDRFSMLSTMSEGSTSSHVSQFVHPFNMSDKECSENTTALIVSPTDRALKANMHTTGKSSSNRPPSIKKARKKSTTAFYVNDDTARARIQRLLVPSHHHQNSNSDLQTMYWENFCTPVPDSPYVIIEVFEHQRFSVFPRRGFNCLNLFITDPAKLSNYAGIKYPDRYLKRAEPPAGYRWVSEKEVTGVVQSPHEVLALIYSPDGWSTHPSYPEEDADENGWTYGTSFDHLRKRCAEGKSRSRPNTSDVVRRRRWLRVATNCTETTVVESIFTNLGVY
jgi:hypothetical protein